MKKTASRSVCAFISLVTVAGLMWLGAPPASATSSGPLVYGVDPYENDSTVSYYYEDYGLQAFNAQTGDSVGGKVITIVGGSILDAGTVTGATGLAQDPTTSTYYVILKVSNTAYKRILATIDVTTGDATTIGDTGKNIAGITFSTATVGTFPAGTLYAVTGVGDSGSPPASLFTLNKTTGAAAHRADLANGGKGEAIGYDPVDNLIYHASGRSTESSQVLETIDPANTFAIADVGYTGGSPNELNGLGFDPSSNTFIAGDYDAKVWSIALDGTATQLSETNNYLRGYVVNHPTQPVAVEDHAILVRNADTTTINVLANDIDGSVTPVGTVASVSQPAHGTSEVANSGTNVHYKPEADYCDSIFPDSFTYTLDTGSTTTVFVRVSCPVATKHLTLKYVATKHLFKGRLTSSEPICGGGSHVIEIYKVDPVNSDHLIGTPTTGPQGYYKLKFKARKGRYYAQSSYEYHPNVSDCESLDSPKIRVS